MDLFIFYDKKRKNVPAGRLSRKRRSDETLFSVASQEKKQTPRDKRRQKPNPDRIRITELLFQKPFPRRER